MIHNKIFSLIVAIFLVFAVSPNDVHARPIISGVSTNEINIDAKFTGAKILLFGAQGDSGDVAIAVRGPKKDYIVNKKGKVAGIWYNQQRVKFEDAYSYYAFFSTDQNLPFKSPLFKGLELRDENIKFSSGIINSDRKIIAQDSDEDFQIQFINLLEEKNLYSHESGKINFLDESLFKVMLTFPKNIASGIYTVEIYLIDDENLVAFQSIPIYVNQIGFSAKIYDMAYNNSFLYGILAIFIAVIFGWLANFIFERFISK